MEEEESEEEEDELPMYQEHYDALFSMDFVETKYPHDDTMRPLGSLRCGVGPQEHALGQVLLLPHGVYKELTCEFLASMRSTFGDLVWVHYGEGTSGTIKEKELQRVWATIADGVYSSSRSKAAQIRSPVLRYVHKALANTFFARKATGQSMKRATLLQDTPNTRQKGRKLSVGGVITPILLCSWSPFGQEKVPIQIHSSIGWPSKLLLPNPELTTVLGGSKDEPLCCGCPQEDWTSPKFNKWQGKAIGKDAKVHGQDGEQDQSLEKKVSGSSSKKKKSKAPLSLGVSLLTTPRRLPAQSLTEPLHFEPREGEDNTQRRRKSSKARRSNSTTGLDRVQTEETQLDRARAEGRVDLEEPLFENPGFEYDPTQYQDFSQTLWTPYNRFEQAQLLQGQGSHTHLKMKKRRRGAASSIE
ncbi:unnamed protein product [Microthlaspi erraticum]|uniref:Arabidopsis retrotransposon Orf1 C-terminal domain-containing protein n=1 Tax=Microthlaspi erraticum TaxID=1685480 RepID=A0A6D2JBG3_9BRAS|nr:unnamed protein product [Microthlaspi erraticum]